LTRNEKLTVFGNGGCTHGAKVNLHHVFTKALHETWLALVLVGSMTETTTFAVSECVQTLITSEDSRMFDTSGNKPCTRSILKFGGFCCVAYAS